MATLEEKQAYLDEIVAKRGYVLEGHKLLANHDLDVLKAFDGIAEAVYLKPRLLDVRTKELLFVLSMVCLRLPPRMIQNHIKLALEAGCTPEEILEAIEIALPEAGLPTFQHGLAAWAEVVGATGVEPSAPSYEGGAFTDRKPA